MNKPSKKFLSLWPYHVRDMSLNVMTFLLSVGSSHRQPTKQMKERLHWYESNIINTEPKTLPNSFSVLSWNVFKGFYEHHLLDNMHRLIAKHNPDAIVLQEAPMYPDGSFLELPSQFAQSAQVYISSQKKLPGVYEFEHTGEFTASKYAYVKSSFHLLPQVTNQKHFNDSEYLHRSFLYTQFKTSTGTLGLYNVHLENMTTPRSRLVQVQALYEAVEKHDDDITVLAGDFNTFMSSALEPAVQFFHRKGFVNGLKPGLKQWIPRLDHIFVRGAKSIDTTVFPRVGSDHKPVIAKIKI